SARCLPPRSCGGVLPRLQELHLRPALLGEPEADGRRREVDELARVIACDVGCELLRELLELTLLGRPQPARGDDVYRLERALDAVLAFQPEGRDVELERADGTEDQIVVHERPEKLRRTFLAELRETLLERLQLQRVAQHGAPEQLRREIRDAGEDERLPLAEAVADV